MYGSNWIRIRNNDFERDVVGCVAGGGAEPGCAQVGGKGALAPDQPRYCRKGPIFQ